MKHIYRIIGVVVVLVVLAAALLYFLNEKGILKGPVSDWVTNVKTDVIDIYERTKGMITDLIHSENPITDSIKLP
ncbi:MAG: hypothetical protein IJL62_08010 [Clostridia bacterium]|nr:hypothetical protein [Clostridia bacterium]